MLTLRYKLHGKEKPHERDNGEPHKPQTHNPVPPPLPHKKTPTKLIRVLVSVPNHPSVHTNRFKAFLQYKPSVQGLCHIAQYIKSLWTTENHCLKQTAQVGN
jgi:hypothetical protein